MNNQHFHKQLHKKLINLIMLTAMILLFSSDIRASAESDYDLGVEAYKAGDNGMAVMYFEAARKQGMGPGCAAVIRECSQ